VLKRRLEMPLEEVMKKEVFTVNDIETIFSVKKARAYKIMKGIKSYSDRLNTSGRIHKKDYEDWLNRFDKEKE
jgi:hypothetical protein